MANLETLEIRVAANAESAAQGLSHLIGSLSALSHGVGRAVGGMMRLNAELEKMRGYSRAKLPTIESMTSSGATRNINASTRAIERNFHARAEILKQFNNKGLANFHTSMYGPNPDWRPTAAQFAADRANTQAARMASAQEYRQFHQSIDRPYVYDSRQTVSSAAMSGSLGGNAQYVAEYAQSAQQGQAAIEIAERAKGAVESYGESAEKTEKETVNLRDSFSNLTSGVSHFFGRIGRIASTMLIRKALKLMVAAAKEGTENLYQYSKGMNGEFASAMDKMSSSLAQLKNAAGTAIAPGLSAIIPILNAISGAAITAFNALSQLFALLGGRSTWTKATAVVQDYADATKKAGGGGGGLKELLADFDELNVIASQGGGGGGGGAGGLDYADMFEEVSVFSSKIRDIVAWIKDNMNSILGIAAAIGTAILAWKVSKAFEGLIGTLAGIISTGAIIAVTCQVVWLMDNQYFKDKNIGWIIGDLLVSAIGATLAGKVLGSVLGSGWGYVAAGFTLELSALTTVIALVKNTDVSALSKESIIAAITAGLKAGAGLFVISKGLIGTTVSTAFGIAASAALVTFGAAIGIKAIATYDGSGLSADTIKAGLLSALGIGAGTAILFKTVGAASLATAGVAGLIAGGLAILTLGAVIAVKAILKPDTKDMKLELTEEQVQAFVKTKMFNVDIDTLVKSINVKLDEEAGLEESVRSQVQNLLSEMNVLSLGIDKAKTLENIKAIIGDANTAGSLVANIASLSEAKIETLKLTFANVKAYDASGNDITAATLLSGIEGWNAVQNEVATLGADLTHLLFKSATEALTPDEEAYVQELLQKIADISAAISNSQAFGTAFTNFQLGLGDLTDKSAAEVLKKFKEYSTELETSLRSARESTIASYNQLAEYYAITGNEEMANKYRELAKGLAESLEDDIKKALDGATEPGKQLIKDYLDDVFSEFKNSDILQQNLAYMFTHENWGTKLKEYGVSAEGLQQAIKDLLLEGGVEQQTIDLMDIVGITGWDMLNAEVQKQIVQALEITPETMSALKDAFGLSASDIIQFSNWDTFTLKTKFDFLNALKSAFGSEEALNAAKSSGINVGNLVQEGMASNDKGIQAMAKVWKELIDGELKPESEVGIGLPEGQPAKVAKEVNDAIEGIKPKVTVDAEVNARVNAEVTIRGGSGYGVVGLQDRNQSGRAHLMKAAGAYDIPRGDVFIANEAGAELVGSINGKTSVANQGQIIEGIAGGVERANSEQNQLLREQNGLLRRILEKEMNVNLGASAGFGRTVQRSLDMYGAMVGGR